MLISQSGAHISMRLPELGELEQHSFMRNTKMIIAKGWLVGGVTKWVPGFTWTTVSLSTSMWCRVFFKKTLQRFFLELELEEGAAGYRISTPPAMLTVPLLAAIDVFFSICCSTTTFFLQFSLYKTCLLLQVFSKTSMSALREKSIWLTGYLEFLVKYYLSSSSPNKVPKKVLNSAYTTLQFFFII